MNLPRVNELAEQLETALGTMVQCGQIILNKADGRVQSLELRVFQRVSEKKSAREEK